MLPEDDEIEVTLNEETDEVLDGDELSDELDGEGAETTDEAALDLSLLDEAVEDEEKPEDDHAAAPWIKDLRTQNRELKRKIREIETATTVAKPSEDVFDPLKEPTLEDPTGNPEDAYNAEKYAAAIRAHALKSIDHENKKAAIAATAKAAADEWQGKINAYGKHKAALKAPDIQEMEDLVADSLSADQQAIIIDTMTNPALVVFALSKNPKALAELAGIKNHIKYGQKLRDFERSVEDKMKGSKVTTKPEERVNVGKRSATSNQVYDALLAKAEKTGDYTEAASYARKLKTGRG